MKKLDYDIVVVGGGPAGLAAALEASVNSNLKILLMERSERLGGILEQCIHNGFGLSYFKEELTGPEYASRFIKEVEKKDNIDIKTGTMVIDINPDKVVIAENVEDGLFQVYAKAVVLAMGCRERTREAITIPGNRVSGVMTAGTAQRYVNINGYLPGKDIIILGSGDIGLIMARRMTLEGCNVKGVLEIMPYSSGLVRNKVQCLDDFDIPLYLNYTVTAIHGKDRVEAVSIAKVDDRLNPISETEITVSCDTLLLSIGLIPENELSKSAGVKLDGVTKGAIVDEKRETNIKGIFACGNVLQVHDLVDNVSAEAKIAGRSAVEYIEEKFDKLDKPIELKPGNNIAYLVPHRIEYKINDEKYIEIYMRVHKPMEHIRLCVLDEKGNILDSYRRDIVVPGSMETIRLKSEFIRNYDFIKVEVQE
ncbi:FAD-binding protein [Clostridiales bacterium COT073_COT-073]|nr:FAD-binding protein [Clostridiales bacterium COT073_COT-073]